MNPSSLHSTEIKRHWPDSPPKSFKKRAFDKTHKIAGAFIHSVSPPKTSYFSSRNLRMQVNKSGNESEWQKEVDVHQEALSRYFAIIEKYGSSHTLKKQTGLKKTTLLKVVKMGLTIESNGRVETYPLHNKEIDGHHISISKKGSIVVACEELGRGKFGLVMRTFNVNRGAAEAIKQAHGDRRAVAQLKNEKIIHKWLRGENCDRKLEGIQCAPREMTTIEEGEKRTVYYQTDLANGDISDDNPAMTAFYHMPALERLGLCAQLVAGLAYAHRMQVVHGDIKPQNCLLHMGKNGVPEKWVIGDWGGAAIGQTADTHTPRYRPYDFDTYSKTMAEGQKADVFALALTLVEVLLGEPLDLEIEEEPGTANDPLYNSIPLGPEDEQQKLRLCHRLKEKGIDEENAQALIGGLGPKENRPSAAELTPKKPRI